MILKGIYKLKSKRELLSINSFVKVYFAFLIFGIFADLIFGIWITKLWSYPSYNLVNYANLYLFIYPFGGFVMIYSFAILEQFFKKPKENRITRERAIFITKVIMIMSAIGFILSVFNETNRGFLIYTTVGFFSYALVDYFVLIKTKDDLLERFTIRPIHYLILILAVAYTQGFLHEFPNVFSKEWIYHNFPFNEITFFGIPIVVLFFGWIYLVIMPFAVYELVRVYIKRNS